MEEQELTRASILEMAMGAIEERVNYEMDRVIANIMDRSTKATGKRKVVVTLELIPDDERKVVTVSASAKSTLVPTNPIMTSLYVGTDPSTGELLVQEMVPQIPGQLSISGAVQPEPKILKLTSQIY